jgi:hypothetical protein
MASSVLSDVSAFEQKLGLPESFYTDLLKNDDWSFVVKLNALVEAACTHALSMRLHAPELEEALANLDLGTSLSAYLTMLTDWTSSSYPLSQRHSAIACRTWSRLRGLEFLATNL